VCNSGVSLSPVVNGKTHHFAARGVYNGLLLMGDRESGSFWDHITGKCVHGPLKGSQLEVFPLLHMNVAQSLALYTKVQIAISKLTFMQQLNVFFMGPILRSKRGFFPPVFKKTMSKEDTRRPRMDSGLGVWNKTRQRYYPLEHLRKQGSALIDEFDGRRLLVYIDPTSNTPVAIYTDATRYIWHKDELNLDTGEIIRGGALYNAQGMTQSVLHPMQMLTRWYGFAFTFPGCELYEG